MGERCCVRCGRPETGGRVLGTTGACRLLRDCFETVLCERDALLRRVDALHDSLDDCVYILDGWVGERMTGSQRASFQNARAVLTKKRGEEPDDATR